ncbi:methylated-DNA--[protein]-cysteine S-methyltransferase [Emcibacter nanhaiensis]|uniref:Methylated-DNA--protein-cysteine methyltransferase n=1 Tax=Emcibacter nanhaiensis TaxID=1505037 RepID=A0A501PR03_9PROT|nr:methylated-DNA--[protein]-cysteine S-methyltransferase [Emcibacter nanhaiensis]TPD62588.1 methylated-DNA--[protein]-cysteine S-methyltransferase [Emcibacter nanhaiensis]
MTDLTIDHIESPVGRIFAVSHGTRICALDFESYEERMHRLLSKRYGDYTLTKQKNPSLRCKLESYFSGRTDSLDDIDVEMQGTPFQVKVWQALRTIPAGQTWTYAQLARAVGNEKAVRAVGTANGQNPVAIIVPCHRVIGSDGTLTGYAGGVERKQRLLELEGLSLPAR